MKAKDERILIEAMERSEDQEVSMALLCMLSKNTAQRVVRDALEKMEKKGEVISRMHDGERRYYVTPETIAKH